MGIYWKSNWHSLTGGSVLSSVLLRHVRLLLLVYQRMNVSVNVCASKLHDLEQSFICLPVSLLSLDAFHCWGARLADVSAPKTCWPLKEQDPRGVESGSQIVVSKMKFHSHCALLERRGLTVAAPLGVSHWLQQREGQWIAPFLVVWCRNLEISPWTAATGFFFYVCFISKKCFLTVRDIFTYLLTSGNSLSGWMNKADRPKFIHVTIEIQHGLASLLKVYIHEIKKRENINKEVELSFWLFSTIYFFGHFDRQNEKVEKVGWLC